MTAMNDERKNGHLKTLDVSIQLAWTIVDCSTRFTQLNPISSPAFFFGNGKECYAILMEFQPNAETVLGDTEEEEQNYTSLTLCIKDDIQILSEINAYVHVTVRNNKNQEFIGANGTHKFVNGFGVTYPQFIKKADILDANNGLLANDTFTIHCKVNILKQISTELKESENRLQVSTDLGQLLQSDEFSDVTLVSQGVEFPVHRNILAARSLVFKAMFTHDMREKTENKVVISGFGPDVLREMLRFVYSGKVENPKKILCELLAAADQYALDGLKDICGIELQKRMKVDNVANMLIIADRHRVDNLKKGALAFISRNAQDVIKTSGFKLISTGPFSGLLAEAFCALASK